jgi:hypothetical protein
MKIQSLSAENLDYIFENLSNQGKVEAETFGLTVEQVKEKFISWVNSPFSAVLSDDRNKPCMAVVLTKTDSSPANWRTNFVFARGAFVKIGKQVITFFRDFTDDMASRNYWIESLSAFGDPVTRKWFEDMGFIYDGQEGRIHKYIKGGNGHVLGRR